jgi:hypothetical protein
MDQRRRDLRIRWSEVARRAGMSAQNLLRIRRGQTITWDAADGIEYALGWTKGSVEAAVLHGTKPTLDPGGPMADVRLPASAPTIDQLPEDERQQFLIFRDLLGTQRRHLTVRRWVEMGRDYEQLEQSGVRS